MEKEVMRVVRVVDAPRVIAFLKKIDSLLPVPLSERVDIESFALRNLERGYVLAIENDAGDIACAAIFYYNFQKENAAYLNLMATASEYGGRGYATAVMNEMEDMARRDGMTEFHLHTNDTNRAALSLYEKRGYSVIGHDPKVHMKKEL